MRLALALGLAALALAGCTNPQSTAGPGDERALTFERIEGCSSDQATEKYVVVQSEADWRALWRDACRGAVVEVGETGGSEPPAVNFTSHAVVAAFWGEKQKGGFAVQITNITEATDHTLVRVARTTPGASCFTTQAITYPADLVQSEPIRRAARFQFDDRVQDC